LLSKPVNPAGNRSIRIIIPQSTPP
jgi:hypothetical protein